MFTVQVMNRQTALKQLEDLARDIGLDVRDGVVKTPHGNLLFFAGLSFSYQTYCTGDHGRCTRVMIRAQQCVRGKRGWNAVSRTFPVRKDGTLNLGAIRRAILELMDRQKAAAEERKREKEQLNKIARMLDMPHDLATTTVQPSGMVEVKFLVEPERARRILELTRNL